jgi:FkbM family methyltransferase
MKDTLFALPAKLFLGKGIDRKFPFLVDLYKKASLLMTEEGEVKVPIPLRAKLLVSTKDTGVGLFLRTKGEFEPVQTKLFIESLKKGDVVFDIGANIGYYTILASKQVGPKGQVYAFEPDPNSLELLKKNIKLNECANVQVVEAALGRKEGDGFLIQDLSNPGESSLAKDGRSKGLKVTMTTLDAFTKARKIKKVDLIKIDVEGAELDILGGAKDFLKRIQDVELFIECNPKALKRFSKGPSSLTRALQKLGFGLLRIINEAEKAEYGYSSKNLKENLERASFVAINAKK